MMLPELVSQAAGMPRDPSAMSLRDVAHHKLTSLGRAVGMSHDDIQVAARLFAVMSESWGDALVGERPPWPNDITDDGTPFEFSVATGPQETELRMLLETQRVPRTAMSSFDAGVALHRRLAEMGLVTIARFDAIADLFRPSGAGDTHFSLWHAAVVRSGKAPLVKAYMSPEIHGPLRARDTVREAMTRLSLSPSWGFLERLLAKTPRSRMRYFALDLDASSAARIKIYVSAESAAEVELQLQGSANVAPGQATEWLRALTDSEGPYLSRPVLTCFAFTHGTSAPVATVHVPIRSYVNDDDQALDRLTRIAEGDAQKKLVRAVTQTAVRPLEIGRGFLTYVSLRQEASGRRVTIYLAPELYAITAARRQRMAYA